MTTSTGLYTALISAAVSLVVFVSTQVWTSRRERRTQAYQRRRAALTDLQDAALQLRTALSEFGPLARRTSGRPAGAELQAAQQRVDAAFALLDVRLTRLDDRELAAATVAWRDLARFHYISSEEVSTADERAAWAALNAGVGAALTSASARSPKR